jgi:hypothetical protein
VPSYAWQPVCLGAKFTRHLQGCAVLLLTEPRDSDDGLDVELSTSSLISMIVSPPSPRSVSSERTVSVGDTGDAPSFSLTKVFPVMLREGVMLNAEGRCGLRATKNRTRKKQTAKDSKAQINMMKLNK